MQNIKHNNVRALDLKLINNEYYDFMLYKGEAMGLTFSEDCYLAEILPCSLESDGKYYSRTTWADAKNSGDVTLNNIGLTGVDNGFIHFDKDKISNKEFLDIFTGSTYTIGSEDMRFFMTPITGNTMLHKYPYSIEVDEVDEQQYFSFRGGFLQGFFKADGYEYQTLPSKIDTEWVMSFELRRRTDYPIEPTSLVGVHPENNGIFFYMGTRAENKFWHYYKTDEEVMDKFKIGDFSEGYMEPEEECDIVTPTCDLVVKESDGNYSIDHEYWESDVDIESNDFKTKEGIDADNQYFNEIETDNKFITFNRTPSGFTVNNWPGDDVKVILEGEKRPNINWFPLMNRTETGVTVQTADEYIKYEYDGDEMVYDIYDDIKNNAFALKINEDGSIGYKYGILDCEAENHYSVVEEYSKPNMVLDKKWAKVTVKFKLDFPRLTKCDNKDKKMKIYIYVDGFLVFISKELPALNFKALDDTYHKQEGVPFNLSLGGGTQGLMEEIFPDYYRASDYVLPLERDFGGSFMGDIKYFLFYGCHLPYNDIQKLDII